MNWQTKKIVADLKDSVKEQKWVFSREQLALLDSIIDGFSCALEKESSIILSSASRIE